MQRLNALGFHLKHAVRKAIYPGGTSDPIVGRDEDPLADEFRAMVARYRPEKYVGDVVLFVEKDKKDIQHSFWKHLIRGNFRIQRISGTHHDLIYQENAPAFAAIFNQILDEAKGLSRTEPSCP
jgi:thioesterase domain-containing protein